MAHMDGVSSMVSIRRGLTSRSKSLCSQGRRKMHGAPYVSVLALGQRRRILCHCCPANLPVVLAQPLK